MIANDLGNTGIKVSHLSLGGLFLAGGDSEIDQAVTTIERAFELGINYIDTAPGYGQSEMALGKIFERTGRPEILSTKVGGGSEDFDAQNPDCLKASIENSLKQLGTDHIEIFMIHEPDRPGQYDWWSDMLKVEGPILDILLDYKEQGVIKNIGLGGTGITELAHLVNSGKFDVVLTAFNYSLLYREAEEIIIQNAKERGMGVIAGSPLQQGAFAAKHDSVYDDKVYWLHPKRREQFAKLYELSNETGISVPSLAIRFVASNPNVDTVLMGARNIIELEQNVEAIEAGPLPEDILTKLDDIASTLPSRPFEEPAGMGRLMYPEHYKGPGQVHY